MAEKRKETKPSDHTKGAARHIVYTVETVSAEKQLKTALLKKMILDEYHGREMPGL